MMPAPDRPFLTLQNVIFPEQNICTEADLYFHLLGLGGYRFSDGSIHLDKGAIVQFDTYFNALSIGKWHDVARPEDLALEIRGRGRMELRVFHAIPDRSWELLVAEVLELSDGQPFLADLSHYAANATRGLIYFELKALKDAIFTGARYLARPPAGGMPRLALSITTFRREAEVEQTVRRLDRFLADYEHGGDVHVFVVDNGASASIPDSPRISLVANPNLGGAGGFARGLAEATAAGFSHVLFMDDDASFHMESIRRTHAMLALAGDSRTAIAGAMINNSHKWSMWENGALFDGSCQPLFCGLDLRQRQSVLDLEFISAREKRANFYGGWWYFAFAVEHARHQPFPFFVRGDDVSFSLANDFRITTLNGVVSFQDDFTEKESPQTLYLDLRSHLVHHLVFAELERSARGAAWVALRFILRSLVRFHYETAEAQLLAWQDVIEGPRFFAENADMAERRARIKALTRNEAFQPIDQAKLVERRKYVLKTRPGGFWHRLFVWSLNGHLLPLFGLWGDRITLLIGERGRVHPAFGAARITYLNSARDKGYTVRINKRRFVGLGWRVAWTTLGFLRNYAKIRQSYRDAYDGMTSAGFWQRLLAPAEPPADPPAPASPSADPSADPSAPVPAAKVGT